MWNSLTKKGFCEEQLLLLLAHMQDPMQAGVAPCGLLRVVRASN